MEERKLNSSLIDALRKGGTYTFVVKVSERSRPSTLAFVADIEETYQNATVKLGEDDISEEGVQEQIASFMGEHCVASILYNGVEVWHNSPSHRKHICFDDSSTKSSI